MAKQKEEDAQIGKQEALQAKKNLKEVRLVVPKLQRSQIVREMDRDRGNDCSNSSLFSSPLLTTKKRHHLQKYGIIVSYIIYVMPYFLMLQKGKQLIYFFDS